MPYLGQPDTWLPNERIKSNKLNREVRDKLKYLLYERASVQMSYFAGALSSTSTSWADVSTANVKVTATINTQKALVYFIVPFYLGFSSAGAAMAHFRVQADASASFIVGDATYGITVANNQGTAVATEQVFIPAEFSGLSQGSHDFRLQWKLTVVSGSGYVMNVPSVAGNHQSPLYAFVLEHG